ncbi:MAG: type I DNA topoisomerase, partial [Oscillospiraceae bacterium]|nr:type I DNA topoisomerase [Oscillospiraceae bacterium]
MSDLVIVESPAKAKTIKKYLGSGYDVIASMGHIRDLPKSKLGVDIENGFSPDYSILDGKKKLANELKEKAKNSGKVYLATDPDREGEAISWHLAYLLGLDLDATDRVTFNEITKSGVAVGMKNPRKIDMDLVNAQQARRIMDRIVGYKLSPFLWKKVRRGLSAGRVQSVAVKIITDRENEIRKFKPTEYWNIEAELKAPSSKKTFTAKFYGKNGKKMPLKNKDDADKILKELENAEYKVGEVKKSVRKKSPAPPFTTSTLQQEASRKLGFQAKRTMKAAQELYEGVELPKIGAVGLITYMRTDSLRVSQEAASAGDSYVRAHYGEKYLPSSPRYYKAKNGAQDAHEAIRPTMPELTPSEVKESLTSEQYKLYKLIWERFIASRMSDELLDTVAADIFAGDNVLKVIGSSVKFDGFTALYEESVDAAEEEKIAKLPEIAAGDLLELKNLTSEQKFTQPPVRYTEAALIKALEENGIGRPSTYASIITTILQREYVEREGKLLKPTQLGEIINKLLEERFNDIVDVDFTANMEKRLDAVEEGKSDWVETLSDFYGPFVKSLEKAEEDTRGVKFKVPEEETEEICELCGRKMVIKTGRFGKFLACPGFPECKNTKKIVKDAGGECPICGGKILAKKSKTG